MPPLDKSSSEPLYQQLYTQISGNIESGLYQEGKKLPSIRAHARELGVSSTTIEAAYLKLASEGYITAKRGRWHARQYALSIMRATARIAPSIVNAARRGSESAKSCDMRLRAWRSVIPS